MKTKGMILAVMMMLMCCSGAWSKGKVQITNLFDGDSLARLNEEQCDVLNYALYLLEENDSVVMLPLELGIMLGDTVCFTSYPEWTEAYFQQEKKKTNLIVPTYAVTSSGLLRSKMIVECKKEDEYKCVIETKLRTSADKSAFNGVYMESSIEGNFLKGKMYKNGVVVSNIEDKVKDKKALKRNRYYTKKWYQQAEYGLTGQGVYKVPMNTPYTDLERASGYPQKFLPKSGL